MIGVYIFVAILNHFSPHALLSYVYPAPTYAALSVSFPKVDGVKVGTPVVVDGAQVGSVTDIRSESHTTTDDAAYTVALRLDSRIRAELPHGTVGLITTLVHKAKPSTGAVIELVSPDDLGIQERPHAEKDDAQPLLSNETLHGFSSLSDFWEN